MKAGLITYRSVYFFLSPLFFLLTSNFSSVFVDDGKFVGDSDVGEFWSFFGGYAPIPRDVPSDQTPSDSSIKLFWLASL